MVTLNFFVPIIQEEFNNFVQFTNAINEDIHINLSSDGGNVDVGFRFYNFIRSESKFKSVRAFGNVNSSAILLYLGFDKRQAVLNSKFVLHKVACELNGQYSLHDFSELEKSLRADVKRYVDVYTERTEGANSPIDIESCLKGEQSLHLSAAAALGAGLVTALD